MAQQALSKNQRPMGVARGGRRRDAGRAALAAVPQEYFAPERQWLAKRGPQLAKLAQQVKMVTAIVNAEKNFVDAGGVVNPVAAPLAQYLTGTAEGDDTSGRQGRTIRVKSLEMRLNFNSATAATTSQTVRVLIVKDNSPNGIAPTVTSLFEGGFVGVNFFPTLSTFQGRFKWLYDETFVLGIVGGGQDSKVLVIEQKLDHHVQYIGTTAAVASAGQGSLFLFVIADSSATNASAGNFACRIRYYDN